MQHSLRCLAWSSAFVFSTLIPRPSAAQDVSPIALSAKAAVARAATQTPQSAQTVAPMSAYHDFGKLSPTLQSLYFVTAVVQGLDAQSTFKALDAGAVEANSIVKPFASNRPAFVALKVGMAAAFIYQGHQMSKRHKIGAIVTLGILNSVYAAIAINNYRTIHTMDAHR
jgi:hypothetical protein